MRRIRNYELLMIIDMQIYTYLKHFQENYTFLSGIYL